MKENEKILTKTVDTIMAICLFFIMMPITIFVNGYVITKLWSWFIVPFGIIQLTMWWALGISTFISWFKFGIATSTELKMQKLDSSPTEIIVSNLFTFVLGAALTLAFGYFFHRMMI